MSIPHTLPLLVAAILSWPTASLGAAESADEPARVLFIGAYMTAQGQKLDMVDRLLEHGGYAGDVQPGLLTSDAHASPTSNHAHGFMDWIRGAGVGHGRQARLAEAGFATGKLAAAVLEISANGIRRHGETDIAAVRAFAAACHERGVPGALFCLGAASTHSGSIRHPKKWRALSDEEFRKRFDEMERIYTEVWQQVDVRVVPTHAVFERLRREHPGIQLHAPRRGPDGHYSPRDHYLAACTIAAVLLDGRPEALPDPDEIMHAVKTKTEEGNAKRRKRGQEESPWFPITAAENEAIHDVVWSVVTEYEARRQAYWDRIPAVSFALDRREIPEGSAATLSWQVTGATQVDIEPEIGTVAGTGERALSPTQTTTYTLTVPGLDEPHPLWQRTLTVHPEPLPALAATDELEPGLTITCRKPADDHGGAELATLTIPDLSRETLGALKQEQRLPDEVCDMIITGRVRVPETGLYRILPGRPYNVTDLEILIGGRSVKQAGDRHDSVGAVALMAGLHDFTYRFRTQKKARIGFGLRGFSWILPGRSPVRQAVPTDGIWFLP